MLPDKRKEMEDPFCELYKILLKKFLETFVSARQSLFCVTDDEITQLVNEVQYNLFKLHSASANRYALKMLVSS